MVVSSKQTVEMLKHNLIAPFKFSRSKDSNVFSFTYRKAAECLGQVTLLVIVTTRP